MKLTAREQEILDILRKEPLISQEELADRLHITRSSAAVHISNLMKKGIILGKGYVINERVTCLVIGEACLQTEVVSHNPEIRITDRFAGFGFETVRSLCRFGLKVRWIGLVGSDDEGSRMLEPLQRLGADLNLVERSINTATTRTVRILEDDRASAYRSGFLDDDLVSLARSREWAIDEADWLMIQPNLIGRLAAAVPSVKKHRQIVTGIASGELEQMPEELGLAHVLVVNGASIQDSMDAIHARWPNGGPTHMIYTDGRYSVTVESPQGNYEMGIPPAHGFEHKEASADFVSGVVNGLAAGYPVRQAVRIGIGAAVSRTEPS
ncbi:MAG: winged helix-turn-helix transcriptional regulator [Solirubrobacterales bacterium]